MNELSFSIDDKLCIISWGGEIAQFTGKTPVLALGNKYYDVLPPISFEGRTLLRKLLKKRRQYRSRVIEFPVCFRI
jgi:hypothetical protein